MEFREFPKIARLSRECVITEKIDGTNGQISIRPAEPLDPYCPPFEVGLDVQVYVNGATCYMRAGSKSRWLGTEKTKDNFGFAAWVHQHAHELAKLGIGRHFGEWWGAGIQRGYGLTEKRFSLFNTARWGDPAVRPACCHVVPILAQGPFHSCMVDEALGLLCINGSRAVPWFMRPEGIVVYHTAANFCFKKTFEKDEAPKGQH